VNCRGGELTFRYEYGHLGSSPYTAKVSKKTPWGSDMMRTRANVGSLQALRLLSLRGLLPNPDPTPLIGDPNVGKVYKHGKWVPHEEGSFEANTTRPES